MSISKPFSIHELQSRSKFLDNLSNIRCQNGHCVSVQIRRLDDGSKFVEAKGTCELCCSNYVWRWARER